MTKRLQSITSKLPAAVALCLLILLWQFLCQSGAVPAYMLPSPIRVVKALFTDLPTILRHAVVTLQEAFYGLCIGVVLAFVMATLMDHFRILNKALYPIMIITQTPFRMSFFGGGTDFESPLNEALRLLTNGFESADVVIITDGECEVSDEFAKRFTEEKLKNRLTVTGIRLSTDDDCGKSLLPFCDKIYRLGDMSADEIAFEVIGKKV